MKPIRRMLTVLALTAAAVLVPAATASATVDDSAWGTPPVELPDLPPLPAPLDSAWGTPPVELPELPLLPTPLDSAWG